MQGKRIFLLFLISLFTAGLCWSQVTSGNMRGVVTDNEGQPIPGATVTISSESIIGGTRTTNTSEIGVFRFPSLPVGTYSVEVSLEGFEKVRVQKVQVSLDATANVPVTMNLAGKGEEVSVIGEAPLIDISQAGVQTNYSKEILEEVPTQRTFTDLIQVSPGVSASTGDSQGDRTVAFGSNQQSNSWNVDGLETTAPETGSVWIYMNPDAIEEIQVIGVGAPAEYGNHTGAVFNIVTKKGGNDFHGSVNYFFQDDALTGTNVELPDVPGDAAHFNLDKFRDFSANIGGPVKRDKLWFYGSFQSVREAATDPGNDPAFATLGKDDRSNFKLTGLLGSHQVTGFYQYNDWASPDNASPFVAPSAVYQERGNDHAWGGGVTSTISDDLLFEANYAGWTTHDLHDSPTGSTEDPFIDYTPEGGGPATYSGGAYYPFDYVTDRHQVNGKATYYAENFLNSQHEFRFGVQFARGNAETLVAAGFNGFYDYNYYGYLYRAYQLPFNYGAVTQDLGFFMDDTIVVNDRLTLNVGVRYDHNTGKIPDYDELAIGTPSITPTVGNFIRTGRSIPGVDIMTWDKISPRLGFVWQVMPEGKAILQGSFGVYYDHNVSGNWDYPSPTTTEFAVFQFNPDTGQFDIPSFSIPPSTIAFDPDIQPPRTLQYAIGYEQQLSDSMAAGVQYVYKDTQDLIGWEILDGQWQQFPFTDPFLGTQYTLLNLIENPTLRKGNSPGNFCENIIGGGSASMCDQDLSNYFQTYHGVVLTFNKRFANSWALNASYTWSQSEGLIPRMLAQVQFNPFYSSLEGSDPNQYLNAFGKLQGDRPHMFRLQGVFFDLPLGLQFSAAADFSSGRHYTRQFRVPGLDQGRTTVIMERNFRLNPIQSVDLTLTKNFNFTKDLRFRVDGTVYNVLNADNELNIADLRLAEGDVFIPDLWTKPRRLQIRVALQF